MNPKNSVIIASAFGLALLACAPEIINKIVTPAREFAGQDGIYQGVKWEKAVYNPKKDGSFDEFLYKSLKREGVDPQFPGVFEHYKLRFMAENNLLEPPTETGVYKFPDILPDGKVGPVRDEYTPINSKLEKMI